MNWVGGTRNRYLIKNDMRRQREFFEKKKLQQKMKRLGIPLPNSPKSTSSGSMDLVTLFIVNQISARKESEPPKISHTSDQKKLLSKSIRDIPLELPMSPCSPSRLSLVESQPYYSCSVPGVRKRKHCLSEQLKCHQLSPVLESNLSDKSVSEHQHHIVDTFSPFSSVSSSSSGRFPHQKSQNQPHFPPLPWNMSSSEKLQFKTVSQSGGVRACTPWVSGSSGLLYQIDTPSVARGLFRSTEPYNTEAREVIECSLNPSENKEIILQVNQSGSDEQHEKDIFSYVNSKEYGAESSYSGYQTSKLYLKEETNRIQIAQEEIDTETKGSKLDCLTQLSSCTDVTCPGNNTGQVDCIDSSPSYSPRVGYISSDSDDDKDDYQQYSHGGSSQNFESRREETFNLCKTPQWTTRLGPSQTRPSVQQTVSRCNGNCNNDNRSKESSVCSERLSSNVGSYNNSQLISSLTLPQPQSFMDSQHKRRSRQTQDIATQTVVVKASLTCEASTQCSWVPGDEVYYLPDGKSNFCNQTVDSVVQHLTTKGQSGHRDHAEIQQTLRISANSYRKGEEPHTPWINPATPREDEVVVGYPSANETCHNTDSSVSISRSATPMLEDLIVTNETEDFELIAGGVDERKIQDPLETEFLMKELPEEREVASAGGVNRLSEEAETLQEIADILLMLKQKKGMGNKGAR